MSSAPEKPSPEKPSLNGLHDLQTPDFGEALSASHRSREMAMALLLRRSTQADMLCEPGPDEASLHTILTIAARVPDHRRVEPFRFICFQKDSRTKVGKILAKAWLSENPDASAEECRREESRFLRAPIVIGVISSTNPDHRTPEWEQVLSTGAVCQNMLLAASAHGFAAQWLTEWYAYDRSVLEAIGVGAHEKIAGFIYIGTAKTEPKERKRPDIDGLITQFI